MQAEQEKLALSLRAKELEGECEKQSLDVKALHEQVRTREGDWKKDVEALEKQVSEGQENHIKLVEVCARVNVFVCMRSISPR